MYKWHKREFRQMIGHGSTGGRKYKEFLGFVHRRQAKFDCLKFRAQGNKLSVFGRRAGCPLDEII